MLDILNGTSQFINWLTTKKRDASGIDMDTLTTVKSIQHIIIQNGDIGLCELSNKFDKTSFTPNDLKVQPSAINAAKQAVAPSLIESLKIAAKNISEFHMHQIPTPWTATPSDGVEYGIQYTPLDDVGLYVPGGRAAYPSSVLMTGIPAKIAGCKRLVMVSPAINGKIPESVLVAADIVGITEIYSIGGAQAIFALAHGTESIPSVDKIVGPGNKYVTAAKQLVYGLVDIDKPAGPSEVCVYIDTINYVPYAAAELLAQLEHDPDASAVAIATTTDIAIAINEALAIQRPKLNRQHILDESIHHAVIVVDPNGIECCNTAASEHLVILSDNATAIRKQVTHAGSIFCGPYTPVTLGDYIAGPNHVLPTQRAARFSSPLGVMDFMKYSSHLSYSKSALSAVADDVNTLTTAEGFDAHNAAVTVRLNHE